MVYRWRDGFPSKGIDAGAAAKELERIRKKKGVLIPEEVVAEARKSRSPLHDAFEWDDTEAANQYRLVQARSLVAAVEIVTTDTEDQKPVRAFVHLSSAGGYQDTVLALRTEPTRQEVMEKARREMESWVRRFGHLEEFAEIVAAADRAKAA